VIGQTACPAEDPSCTEKSPLYMLFSGPDEISRETVNGTTVEWYQPVHEPGEVFSYPWSLDQLEQRTGDLQLLTGVTSFYTDDSERTVQPARGPARLRRRVSSLQWGCPKRPSRTAAT
jgi:hypothetical protein